EFYSLSLHDALPILLLNDVAIKLAFGKLILFEGKKILLVDKEVGRGQPELTNKLHADLLILSGNPKVYLKELNKLVDFTKVIFRSEEHTSELQSREK